MGTAQNGVRVIDGELEGRPIERLPEARQFEKARRWKG